jgi:hypothetical protein
VDSAGNKYIVWERSYVAATVLLVSIRISISLVEINVSFIPSLFNSFGEMWYGGDVKCIIWYDNFKKLGVCRGQAIAARFYADLVKFL